MKSYKLDIVCLLFVMPLILFTGCSSDNLETSDLEIDSTKVLTNDEQIEMVMNQAMDRIRYKDKSFIYEMEFDYYKDEVTFDEYLAHGRIKSVSADTIEFVDVLSVEYFDGDSASAVLEFHFKGPSGQESVRKTENNKFYKRNGRWIKPTLSLISRQLSYEEIQRQARESAEKEAGN